MTKCIAIITARGGSKRIPRKNIKDFCGQPIIKYSIDAAKKSGCFDEIMVSTDDQEIVAIVKKFGANVPFLRSQKTSSDFASTEEVIEEVVLEYQKIGQNFDYLCCIYPTAPFISSKKIKEAYELILKTGVDSVLPIVKFSYPIQRALKIENKFNIKLKMISGGNSSSVYLIGKNELPQGINIDIAKDGTITGIEILRASKVFSGDIKKVIEQAKPLAA